MRSLLTLAVLFAVVSPALSLQSIRNEAGADTVDTSQLRLMPEIKLGDLDGKPVPADRFKGRVLVVDFWATWCGPCITEIPFLNSLQDKYQDRDVQVIGVTMTSGEASEVKPFVSRHKMKYTVLMGDDSQAYDFNLMGFPTTFVVTRDWKIYKKYIGAGPRKGEQIRADIEFLLNAQ